MKSIKINDASIVFVGGGKMGEAIIGGWIDSRQGSANLIGAAGISVVEVNDDRKDHLGKTFGVRCVGSAEEISEADVVVLAVKPQAMMDALTALRALPVFEKSLFISIAAGLTTARLVEALPQNSRLIRVMPNTPLLVGQGASAVCASSTSTDEDLSLVLDLFDCLGQAVIVEESAMDVVTALSGSGPAYVAAMLESLTRAAVGEGLDAELAERLAIQTALGTMILISETGQSPQTVRESVSSPGGTTLAALAAMSKAGMDKLYCDGVSAAVNRSKELGA